MNMDHNRRDNKSRKDGQTQGSDSQNTDMERENRTTSTVQDERENKGGMKEDIDSNDADR